MLALIIILAVFALLILLVYSPAIYHYCAYRRLEAMYEHQLASWRHGNNNKLIVVTRRLGEGTSKNSDIRFSEAHKHIQFAIGSISETVVELIED